MSMDAGKRTKNAATTTKRDVSGKYRHWKTTRDADGIHTLAFDRADDGVNTLNEAVLEEFDALLTEIESDLPKGLIIRSGKETGFIYGADVREFAGLTDAAAVKDEVRRGHDVLDRLARLDVPTVAMIHGTCLGGGLELALACRYRVVCDDARLGLPEVMLGIHPGLGGTVRLTRLLPATSAMELMLAGRTVTARRAKKMGLVDVVTQARHLEAAARLAIVRSLKRRHSAWKIALFNCWPTRPILARIMRRKTRKKVRPEHYPAPYALIELWEKHGGNAAAMMAAEAESVAALITGETAQNLVRVFFLRERLRALGKDSEFPKEGHVHVVGAGVMGGDIAAWCAAHGFTVTLQDRGPEFIAPAMQRAQKTFARRFRGNRVRIRAATDRLIPDLAGIGVIHADVVIEAIVEQLDAKKALFKDIEPRLKADALLATNTSSIPLEDLARGLKQPNRLIGLHFFNPVPSLPLVEVVRGKRSAPESVARGRAFARRIEKLPLPVRSVAGFLVNRALTPYMLEAMLMMEEGMNAVAIDAAAEAFGMPMGPVELADSVGLDICLHVGEMLSEGSGIPVPGKLSELVEAGHLGRKTGKGFYPWKDGKAQKTHLDGNEVGADIADRLILPMLNTCVACLREKVVEDAELIDAGMIFGTGFAPFRGGPLHYASRRGIGEIVRTLEALQKTHGDRFMPDEGWTRMMDAKTAA